MTVEYPDGAVYELRYYREPGSETAAYEVVVTAINTIATRSKKVREVIWTGIGYRTPLAALGAAQKYLYKRHCM